MQLQNKEHFNKIADDYVNEWTTSKTEIEKIKKIVKKFGITQGMKIVEAGCGKGDFSPFILEELGKRGFLWSVDISDKMLNYAKRQLEQFQNITFLNEDFEYLSLTSETIDMIIFFNCFPHFFNKLNVLKESYRLLKPEGILIIAHSLEREKINEDHKIWGFDVQKHHLPDQFMFRQLLRKSGFRIEQYRNKSYFLIKAKRR